MVSQAIHNLLMDLEDTGHAARIRFLIRDRDAKCPALIDKILGTVGITTVQTGVRMNSVTERWGKTRQPGGDQQNSYTETFFEFVRDLGPDMAKFEADVNDSAIVECVLRDHLDAMAVGVQDTPTFFVNGSGSSADRGTTDSRLLSAGNRPGDRYSHLLRLSSRYSTRHATSRTPSTSGRP